MAFSLFFVMLCDAVRRQNGVGHFYKIKSHVAFVTWRLSLALGALVESAVTSD